MDGHYARLKNELSLSLSLSRLMMESVAKERNGPPCRGEPPLEWIAEERGGGGERRQSLIGRISWGILSVQGKYPLSLSLILLQRSGRFGVVYLLLSRCNRRDFLYKTDPTIHHHPLRSSSSFSLSIPFGVLYDFRSRFTQHWRPHSPAASTDRLN